MVINKIQVFIQPHQDQFIYLISTIFFVPSFTYPLYFQHHILNVTEKKHPMQLNINLNCINFPFEVFRTLIPTRLEHHKICAVKVKLKFLITRKWILLQSTLIKLRLKQGIIRTMRMGLISMCLGVCIMHGPHPVL